jgi:hypothetical protein
MIMNCTVGIGVLVYLWIWCYEALDHEVPRGMGYLGYDIDITVMGG